MIQDENMKMLKVRITKYNPIYRDDNGYYTLNDWTSFSDIGKEYNNSIFTLEEYIKVENSYLSAIDILFNKAMISDLR